jgi:hypothetical protein
MYAGAIITLIVGTLVVLLVPAVVLAGSVPGRLGKRRSSRRR